MRILAATFCIAIIGAGESRAENCPQWRTYSGSFTMGSPAVSDGQIFIRTAGALWAIGKRK